MSGINFTGFYEALLEAKGVDLSASISASEDDNSRIQPMMSARIYPPTGVIRKPRDCWSSAHPDEVNVDDLTALAAQGLMVRQAVAWHDSTP